MKIKFAKLVILVLLTFCFQLSNAFAQVPQAINFQAIARDGGGNPMMNTNLQIRLSVLDSAQGGSIVYQELRALQTNDYGSFSFQIGVSANFVTMGTFQGINWVTGNKHLKIDYDPTNTFTFTYTLGVIKFVTVPYAFTAQNVVGISLQGATNGQVLVYNSTTGRFEPGNSTGDGSETKVQAGTNVTVTGTGTTASPYIINSTGGGSIISGTTMGDLLYWNGSAWILLHPGTTGQVLAINGSSIPGWQNSSTSNLLAPTVTTQTVTNILMNSATFNGLVNANGLSTTPRFEYGTTTSYGSSINASPNPVTGGVTTSVSANVALSANTTYHYRIIANNAVDYSYGSDQTFTTPGSAPTASAVAASFITISGATLNGLVNANGYSTVVTFEYGLTTSYGTIATAVQSPISGNYNANVNANIAGLTENVTYHYRVKAVNALGTIYSSDMTFTTLGQPPTVSVSSAADISSGSATLRGVVNANYLNSVVTFEYGLTTSYGNSITTTQSPVSGSTNTNVSAGISGLTFSTIYHYRVKAVNSLGTVYSSDMQFTTLPINVGDYYAGGIIFYIDITGQHGLVCAPTDQSTGAAWGCDGVAISGADSSSVGWGNQNTLDIIAGCATPGIAARICNNLVLGGYDDWFLPSWQELVLMRSNIYQNGLGDFGEDQFYWSSTEYFNSSDSLYYAIIVKFTWDEQNYISNKNNLRYVRAVRAF